MKLDVTDLRCRHEWQVPHRPWHIKFGGRLFGHDTSVEEAMEKPATVALVAIDPYLRAVLPFGAVIVALDVLRAPPAGRDPFRPPRADDQTVLSIPHHTDRRTIRNRRSHIDWLGSAQESQ